MASPAREPALRQLYAHTFVPYGDRAVQPKLQSRLPQQTR